MAIENFDQAVEALTNAANGTESVDTTPTQPAVSQPNEPGTQAVEAPATPVVEKPQIDLNSLDPQVRSYVEAREREMQADYTRKTQEVAAQRKEAEQALEFINALNTDPSFALQVHQTLSQALQQQGYSVEQANAIANQQVQSQDDLFVDPYMEKIQELENWKTAQEQRIREAEAAAQIESHIAAIRHENPNYTDDDVKDILTMAFAYGGDLRQAADAYKTVTQRIVEGYIGQKESVPASLNQPSSTGHAEIPPEGFKSLNDPRLEEAARRMLAESGAQF